MVLLSAPFTAIASGSIQVNISPPEAVAAGAKWEARVWGYGWGDASNSGETIKGFAEGSTPVRGTNINGWITPSETSVNVQTNKVASTTLIYVKQAPTTGSIQVNIFPSEAIAAGAKWEAMIWGIGWVGTYNSGESISSFPEGSTPIRFTNINGWTSPPEQNVTVQAGQVSVGNGTYQPTGSLNVNWKEPASDGIEMTGSIIYADGVISNPNGIKQVFATFEDNLGHKYIGNQSRANSVTEESFGIALQPISQGFLENSVINVSLSIIDGSDQRIDNIANRSFKWCSQSPCVAKPINKEPTFISGVVNSATVAEKGSLQFRAVFKDPENNPIIGVKARYRRESIVLGAYPTWTEVVLDYENGSVDPTFSKTISMDVSAGTYEFEFQASDVEQLNGAILHTTAWQGLGQFSVIGVTNNQPPILNVTKLPIIVKKCQPVSITFQVSDPDKNLREVQVDWSGEGNNVTGHLVGDGQTVIVSSPVGTDAKCPSKVTDKNDATLSKWTATAYDTLGAKSKMVKAGYYINRFPVSIVNAPKVGGNSQSVSVCSKNGKCVIGDPVNPATGSQIMDLTLLKVNGVLPISFSLSYDSAILDSNGIIGKAWSSNLSNTRLEQTPDNDVIIHWSESQYNTFLLQEDGSYLSSDNRTRFDNLIKNANGSFTLTRQSKAIYDFNATGQLQVIRNPQNQRLTFEYDSTNKLSKVSEPISDVFLSYVYNAAGLLESVSDSLGRKISLAYNSAGYLETITDAAQQTVTYSYDSAGRILKAVNSANDVLFVNTYDANGKVATQDDSNPNNQLLRFAYSQDANGNDVTTVTQRDGSTRTFIYNGAYQLLNLKDELNNTLGIVYDEFSGLPLESVNAKGAKTQLKYDDKGNLTSGINAKGIATQITYDTFNNPLSIIDGLGNKDSFVYNNKQLLISATNALNQTTTLTYNNDNQVSTITSPKGAVKQYEYLKGLLSKVTDAEGQIKTLTRDAAGRIIKITDALGKSSELGWDAVNRLISITDALGRVTKLAYNARDKITSITDPKGNVTTFDYDSNGNRIKVTNALGEITRFEYDAEDRLIKIIDALNQTSQLVRDATGRVIKTIDPLGNSHEIQLDALGNVIKSIDALGQTVATLEYDILDNVTKATDALGNSASIEYDSLDRAVKSIDPLNRATEYQYDVLSRLEKSVDALKGQSSQTFDADGELVSFKDPNQHETRSAFDKSGRMIEQTTTTGGKVSYRYNANNLLIELKNARGQARTVEYDAVGRIAKWTDSISSRTYQYDDNDNILSVIDSVAGKVSFSYDQLNRVSTYIDAQGNKLSYTYDVVGNLTTLTYPDNKQVKYAYDARGSLISVTDWANRVTRYSYDANGRLIKEERPNKTVSTQRYDVMGRLVEKQDLDATGKVIVSFNYRYDAAGNIVEEQMLPEPDISAVQSMTMEYGLGNSLSKVDAQATPFDLDGNLLQAPLNGTLTDFIFNQRNQLVKAANLEYGYDALGYRDVVKENTKTTRYVLNPLPALHQVLIKIAPDGTKTFYVYGLGLIGEETNGKYLSYHFDYRGSTVALTANDGQVVNRFAYEPYGGLLGREALLQGTPFLFNGRYGVMTDPNGLYQMRARYYHPELRRFINQDPVFLGTLDDSQSLNRFAYVTGNPVSLIDPFGLCYEVLNNSTQAWSSFHEEAFKQSGNSAGAKVFGYAGKSLNIVGGTCSTLKSYNEKGGYAAFKTGISEFAGYCVSAIAGAACATSSPASLVFVPTCSFVGGEVAKSTVKNTLDGIENTINSATIRVEAISNAPKIIEETAIVYTMLEMGVDLETADKTVNYLNQGKNKQAWRTLFDSDQK